MLAQPAHLAGSSHLGLTCNTDGAPGLGPDNMAFSTNAADDGATVPDSEDSDLEASFAWHDEETRLRYARLAARARAQELAYAQKLARQNEMEHERARDRQRDQSRSRSRSRSNTRNSVFTGLFHHRRERQASHHSASLSRPGTPTNEKTYATFLYFLFSLSRRTQLTIQQCYKVPSSQVHPHFPFRVIQVDPLLRELTAGLISTVLSFFLSPDTLVSSAILPDLQEASSLCSPRAGRRLSASRLFGRQQGGWCPFGPRGPQTKSCSSHHPTHRRRSPDPSRQTSQSNLPVPSPIVQD